MKIPKGHERNGIKVKCTKCTYHIKNKCPLTKKRISSCEHSDKHRYNLVVYVPGMRNKPVMRLLDTKSPDEAVLEMAKFRKECKTNNYHKTVITKATPMKTSLFDMTISYLNSLEGNSDLEIHNQERSKGHVSNIKTALNRFSECMIKAGYKLETLDVKDIGDNEANEFLKYLQNYTESKSLHKKDFVTMKSFFKWINKIKEYKISNPFEKAQIKVKTQRTAQMISPSEFSDLLKATTLENGYWEFKNPTGHQKGKQLYRPYLIQAFRGYLETGCRGEELAILKWNQIREVETGIEIFDITNLKVTRIQSSRTNLEYNRPIPITQSLKVLLIELGYKTKKGSDEYVFPRPSDVSPLTFVKIVSRAFNHFIKFVNTKGRKKEFKDMRKTYFTYITMALGNKAKLFTGHADEKVLEDSYVVKEFMAGKLSNFTVFDPKKEHTLIQETENFPTLIPDLDRNFTKKNKR